MFKSHSLFTARSALCVSAAFLGALGVAAAQQVDDAQLKAQQLKLEIYYIEQLNNLGLQEYGELVLKDVEKKFPEARATLKVTKLEQVLQLGKFEDAEKIIAEEPDQQGPEAWAMRLKLADYQYSRGDYDTAVEAYQGMLKKFAPKPPEAIKSVYENAAYKLCQMYLFLNREKEAVAAYGQLVNLPDLAKDALRQFQFEYAELLVKQADGAVDEKKRTEFLKKAREMVDKLLWQQDLWFGRAVALMAHMRKTEGKAGEAKKLVDGYMDQLLNIDEQLRIMGEEDGADYSNLSPIAECRYLLADIAMGEGLKLLESANGNVDIEDQAAELLGEAIEDFTNVFVQYPSYKWAPDAINKCEDLTRRLNELGFEIESTITDQQRQEVATKQFETAGRLYHQSHYKDAIETYENVLRAYPEVTPQAIDALNTMIRAAADYSQAQAEEDEKPYYDLYAAMVTGYLAERFAQADTESMDHAGNCLRSLALFFEEKGKGAEAEYCKELFFSLYTEHKDAAIALMNEAETNYKADPPNYELAAKRYSTLVEKYSKKEISYLAQQRLAECYSKLGKTDEEIAVRQAYAKRIHEKAETEKKNSADIIIADYALARALRSKAIQELRDATIAYDEIRRGVAAPATPSILEEEAPAADETAEAAPAEPEKDPKEAALQRLKAANTAVAKIANQYGKLIAMLTGKDRASYEANAKEKKTNNSILQSCLFDRGYCLASLNQPEAAISKYKLGAAQMYEAVLQKFPESESIPVILLQLGTIYSTIRPANENPDEAEANRKKAAEYFDRLAKDYPESEQARNALFLQGKALLELGYRTEGVSKFKEMISTPGGKYSAQQLYQAGLELFNAKEYALAGEAYDSALKLIEGDDEYGKILSTNIAVSKADILYAEGKYAEAVDAFSKFIRENPRNAKVIAANEMLGKAAVLAADQEEDEKTRNGYFRRAIDAINSLRPYRTGAAAELDIKLQLANITETQAKVEARHKNTEAEQKFLRSASTAYVSMLMGINRSNMELRPALETALSRTVKLLLRLKTYTDGTPVYEDVLTYCREYKELFPKGPHSLDISNAMSEADIALSGMN